jgi:hypothetical protein
MKFSPDGNYLATAGQDSIVRVWVVVGSPAADAPEAASLMSGSRSTSGASTPKSVRSNSIGGGGGGGQPAGSAPNSARGVPVARSHTPSPRQQPTPAPSSHSGFAAAPSATGVSAPNSARGAPSSSRGVAAPSSARGLDGHHHHALPTPPSTPGSNRISPASSVSLNASSMMQLQQSDFLAMQPPEFSQPLSHSSAAAFAAEAAADAQGDGGGGDGNIGVEGDHDDVHRAVAREIPSAQGGRHFIFKTPLRMYAGHKSDVIDLAWSKVCLLSFLYLRFVRQCLLFNLISNLIAHFIISVKLFAVCIDGQDGSFVACVASKVLVSVPALGFRHCSCLSSCGTLLS